MDKTTEQKSLHSFSLSDFKKATSGMAAKSGGVYRNSSNLFSRYLRKRDYTLEEVERILRDNDPIQQQMLSRYYFDKEGLYQQMVMHYGTLLKNIGILIPNPAFETSLQDSSIAKEIDSATVFVEKMKLPERLTKIALNVLIDGSYYGVITKLSKTKFVSIDLPFEYCRVRYQDAEGDDVVEFNVNYFSSLGSKEEIESALSVYPDAIQSYNSAWTRSKSASPWMILPKSIVIHFVLFDGKPYFLSSIPSILAYENAVEQEAEKAEDEIKKLLVQKVPHLNDGALLFEPTEAEVMHSGAVDMLKESNPNMGVLTTYADVEVTQSRSTDSITHTALEQMSRHVYTTSGISSQIFAATGSSSLKSSLDYDTSVMMVLGNKFSNFITSVVNRVFATGSISFHYNLMAITHHNAKDFITDSFKLAQSGYSFLVPSLALGMSQRDLMNIKNLENNLLKMSEVLIPLQSAYTQSGGNEGASGTGENGRGRPELDPSKKTEKTNANRKSSGKD